MKSSTPTKGDSNDPITISTSNGTFSREDIEMDEDLPADVFEAVAMISVKAGNDYPTYVPTGLVDAEMVAAQVVSCAETLQFAGACSGLLETVDKLRTGLTQYNGAVSQIMQHLQSISTSAKMDLDRVCEHRLTHNFGLPVSKGDI